MPTLTASGVGSGLDIEDIIGKLMAVERRPLDLLKTRQRNYETQLSDYGKLKSAMSTFKTAVSDLATIEKFRVYATTSSDDTVAVGSADSTAAAGTYDISVTQLAQAHKMASSVTVADGTTAIGATGTLQISVGDPLVAENNFSVTIDGTNNTLNGIRDAINDASDNTGVTASVINVDDGLGGTVSKLVLTSKETGTENELTVTDTSGTVGATLNMATIAGYEAKDAIFTVDTYEVTRSSNTVTDVLQGMSFTLKKEGESATLTVDTDLDEVKTNVQAFVDAYNKMQATVNDLREGSLKGENTIISVGSRIRDVFNTAPTGLTTSLESLSEVGIKTNRDGTLSLDSTVLTSALESDFEGVAELFANDDQGFAYRLTDVVDELLAIDTGLLKTRTDALDARIRDLSTQETNMEFRLDLIEGRLRKQFTTLDVLVMQMQSTSTYLSQQLSRLVY